MESKYIALVFDFLTIDRVQASINGQKSLIFTCTKPWSFIILYMKMTFKKLDFRPCVKFSTRSIAAFVLSMIRNSMDSV